MFLGALFVFCFVCPQGRGDESANMNISIFAGGKNFSSVEAYNRQKVLQLKHQVDEQIRSEKILAPSNASEAWDPASENSLALVSVASDLPPGSKVIQIQPQYYRIPDNSSRASSLGQLLGGYLGRVLEEMNKNKVAPKNIFDSVQHPLKATSTSGVESAIKDQVKLTKEGENRISLEPVAFQGKKLDNLVEELGNRKNGQLTLDESADKLERELSSIIADQEEESVSAAAKVDAYVAEDNMLPVAAINQFTRVPIKPQPAPIQSPVDLYSTAAKEESPRVLAHFAKPAIRKSSSLVSSSVSGLKRDESRLLADAIRRQVYVAPSNPQVLVMVPTPKLLGKEFTPSLQNQVDKASSTLVTTDNSKVSDSDSKATVGSQAAVQLLEKNTTQPRDEVPRFVVVVDRDKLASSVVSATPISQDLMYLKQSLSSKIR